MTFMFVGLDGEMSGTELSEGARLIQIGLALDNAAYTANINPGELSWDPEAEAVHKIPRESLPSEPNADVTDANAYSFLVSLGADPKRRNNTIAVGWNVGSFDMPFVKETLPQLNSLFSRRTVDLNALCFALDGKEENGMRVNAETWKKRSKEYAIEKIGYEDAHNAGWDAKMSLYCFYYLREQMSK